MDSANDFAIALDMASQEVIEDDFALLTKELLELYESRLILEHNAWVKLIEKRDATARADALKEAADRAINWLNDDGKYFDPFETFDELRSIILADKQEERLPLPVVTWGSKKADKQEEQ